MPWQKGLPNDISKIRKGMKRYRIPRLLLNGLRPAIHAGNWVPDGSEALVVFVVGQIPAKNGRCVASGFVFLRL
jgi:hypothetical protein